MRIPLIAILLFGLAGAPAVADTENLQQILRDVEQATEVTVALRGDGEFTVTSPEGTRTDQMVTILRPPADTYIELRQEGIKWLFLSKAAHAYVLSKGAAKAEEIKPESSVAGSDFTSEDLEPFRMSRFKDARISDESESELTVTLFPKASQYSLVVMTVDRQKNVPVKTLYYRDTLNNLVKMRRDEGYVPIGRKWLPTRTSMETFKLRTHTTFTLHWTQNASFPPELFDPVFLTRPGITWPAAGKVPTP